jgi:hypothetical protein
MLKAENQETCRELAVRLGQRFPGTDWIAELAARSGKPRDYVEWHLQQDLAQPEPIRVAAEDLLADPAPKAHGLETPPGLDLPHDPGDQR